MKRVKDYVMNGLPRWLAISEWIKIFTELEVSKKINYNLSLKGETNEEEKI